MFSFFSSRRARSKPLDGYLERYLTGTYGMSEDETENLRFARSGEKIAGKTVNTFRIYNPELTDGPQDEITYVHLDKFPTSIMFEGRYSSNGSVTEIKDLRR